jgi:hypothetical protein
MLLRLLRLQRLQRLLRLLRRLQRLLRSAHNLAVVWATVQGFCLLALANLASGLTPADASAADTAAPTVPAAAAAAIGGSPRLLES